MGGGGAADDAVAGAETANSCPHLVHAIERPWYCDHCCGCIAKDCPQCGHVIWFGEFNAIMDLPGCRRTLTNTIYIRGQVSRPLRNGLMWFRWGRHSCLSESASVGIPAPPSGFESARRDMNVPHAPIRDRQECLPHRAYAGSLEICASLSLTALFSAVTASETVVGGTCLGIRSSTPSPKTS